MKKKSDKNHLIESKMTINRQYDHKFKFMMLGDAGVGKTSIARRFVDEAFLHTYIHTIGIDFLEKVVDLEGQKVLLQIWDTAGQDRFRTLIRPYYRGAAGMIMVYDVTDEKTFDSIEEWMRCIAENTQECQIIQKVILANKTDLSDHRVMSEDGRQLASKHGVDFFEGSAKEGHGITEAFIQLSRLVLKAQQQHSNQVPDNDTIHLDRAPIPVHAKRDRQCCNLTKK